MRGNDAGSKGGGPSSATRCRPLRRRSDPRAPDHAGLTQQQMADLIGVTYQQAHKYEKGINRVAAGRLYSIARALGVEVGYFYEGVISRGRLRAVPQPADAPGPRP